MTVIVIGGVVARNWWQSFQTQYNFVCALFFFFFKFFGGPLIIAGAVEAPTELKGRRALLAIFSLFFLCFACIT